MNPRLSTPSTMTDLMEYIIPAAYRVLPEPMRSDRASAMLITAGLQETKFLRRRQMLKGPARGLWQFEKNGLFGIFQHPRSRPHLENLAKSLRYPSLAYVEENGLLLVEHNDILACALARLLLWTDLDKLPSREQPGLGWEIYYRTWHPGRPHYETWTTYFEEAWQRVDGSHELR